MANDLTTTQQPTEAVNTLPAFEGLTQLQSNFVRCYVANGDGNATKAARDAGYTENSAHAVGYRLLRRDNILAAIERETRAALGATGPIALAAMTRLLNAKSEFVRQQAASDLLDRAGYKPPERHQHLVAGSLTVDIRLD